MPFGWRSNGFRSCCPLVRSQAELIDAAVALASIGSSDSFLDLGCGDGRVLVRVAQLTGAAGVMGVDVNPYCIQTSRRHAATAGLGDRVRVEEASFLELSPAHPLIQAATVIYVYLIPKVVRRLEPLLRAAVLEHGKRVLIFCTHGGNRIGDLAPRRVCMGGCLALFAR